MILSDRRATFRSCPRSRVHRAPPPLGRPLAGRLLLRGAQVALGTHGHSSARTPGASHRQADLTSFAEVRGCPKRPADQRLHCSAGRRRTTANQDRSGLTATRIATENALVSLAHEHSAGPAPNAVRPGRSTSRVSVLGLPWRPAGRCPEGRHGLPGKESTEPGAVPSVIATAKRFAAHHRQPAR
jgi:hypothetical protein